MDFKELVKGAMDKLNLKAMTEEEHAEYIKLKEQKFVSAMTADGNAISQESESWEEGAPIFVEGDEEQLPLPAGEYTLEDGTVLVVVEEGILSEVRAVEVEEEEEEEEEFATKSELQEFKQEVINEVTEAVVELLKQEFSEEEVEEETEEETEVEELAAKTISKEKKEFKKVDVKNLTGAQKILALRNK